MTPLRLSIPFVLGLASTLAAQEPPHLSMRLNVNIGSGSLASRACLSQLPGADRYEFILHRGLNIKSIQNGAGTLLRYMGDVAGEFRGEGVLYTVIDSVDSGDSLCVDYVGAFPVYAVDRGDFSIGDNKGHIAFTGHTVRANTDPDLGSCSGPAAPAKAARPHNPGRPIPLAELASDIDDELCSREQ